MAASIEIQKQVTQITHLQKMPTDTHRLQIKRKLGQQ